MNLLEHIQHALSEKVLNIGLNPDHEKHREAHRQEFHDLIRSSYKGIGGYGGLGHGSDAESEAIHHDISHTMIKATKRSGKISALIMYKKQHGRKSIALGTDGTAAGKSDVYKLKDDDIAHKRSWGEFSGAAEHLARKGGAPVISPKIAARITKKKIHPDEDGEHYTRDINGHPHRKVAMGFPKD